MTENQVFSDILHQHAVRELENMLEEAYWALVGEPALPAMIRPNGRCPTGTFSTDWLGGLRCAIDSAVRGVHQEV